MKSTSLLKISILLVLFILLFYPIYPTLYERYAARDSYYSHGFLVPFVSMFLVWRKRKKLFSLKPKPLFAGLIIIFSGILLHLLSAALNINFTSYLAVLVIIIGIVLYLRGKEFLRELLFPICFLIFMLPLPQVLIIGISFKLKILAAEASTVIGKSLGVQAQRVGSTIYYPGGFLLVGDPCSGLRSLISFLALGALFTNITQAAFWKKNFLFLLTVPIALLSNITRLTFLLFVSFVYGEKIALGFLHDFSGFMVFVLGLAGFIAASKFLNVR